MEWANKYYPKRLYFMLEGIIARTQLAMLDYNRGTNNTQITTKDGERKYKFFNNKKKKLQNRVEKKISEE